MRTRRPLVLALVAPAVIAAAALAGTRIAVTRAARDRVHTVESAPTRAVAVVFGAGLGSTILRRRVEAGAALWRAGKVTHLLLSGDNRTRAHDEPRAMRQIAMGLGVPDEALVLDYAGRRTFDSCARARSIFSVEGAILVTQRFHLDRALYLCRALGLDAVGVAADAEDDGPYGLLQAREVLAGARAFFDVHVRRPYVIGGEPLPIRAAAREPAAPPPPTPGHDPIVNDPSRLP